MRAYDVEDSDDPPEIYVLLLAFDGQDSLRFPAEIGEEICYGLTSLSNHCEELSREPRVGAFEQKANRWASLGLTGACGNLRKILRDRACV